MSRFLSLLLIPFFVWGHALPHSHAGTCVDETDGHTLRPHVHLHGHEHSHDDHHAHGEASEPASLGDLLLPAAEHDSDAVYWVASGQLLTRVSGAFGIDIYSIRWREDSMPNVVDTRPRCRTSDPPDRYRHLPIYLLTASLRL